LRKHKIVSIVDDDQSVRVSTASLVRSMGWHARVYASADLFLKSIEAAGVKSVGCIVCDVQMPGMTGLELQRKLREDEHLFSIIFVTAYSSDEVNRAATSGGAMCVLEKPVDPALLCDWLSDALDHDE
jgi:FixJ family two-component response regulator